MLNPRQVEAFRTVIVTGGVTAAAQALNITQPAVTRLIHDLQTGLGLTLFVRRGSRLVPTNEALSLYREVERQFVGLKRIEDAAHNLREGRVGSLRIAVLPSFAAGFLPRLAGHFLAERPDLDIALHSSISSQIADWVASGFCEVGFAELPLDFPGVEIEVFSKTVAVAVVPRGHRLADKEVLTPADFSGESFISLERSRYRIDAVFSAERVQRTTRIETPLSMIACGLISSGAGVSLVDPFTAEEFRGRGVEIRPFIPEISFDYGVVWGVGRFRSSLALDFAAHVRSAVSAFNASLSRVVS